MEVLLLFNSFVFLFLTDLPLPAYILENIDDSVKQVLFGVHERASLRRMTMSQSEKDNLEKSKGGKARLASGDKAETISAHSIPQSAAGISTMAGDESHASKLTESSHAAEATSVPGKLESSSSLQVR